MMPIGFATENHETLLDVDHIFIIYNIAFSGYIPANALCQRSHRVFLRWQQIGKSSN